jgi:membrane protein YdbS with pleckstrin-like domain
MFDLSSIKIFTAGGNASDLAIPGLSVPDAQKLKAFISEKISRNE